MMTMSKRVIAFVLISAMVLAGASWLFSMLG